jgi:hypothetical protein
MFLLPKEQAEVLMNVSSLLKPNGKPLLLFVEIFNTRVLEQNP